MMERLAALVAASHAANAANRATVVELMPDAEAYLDQLDEYADDQINGARQNVTRELWNRAHIKALKLAALIAVGCNPEAPIVTLEMATWARDQIERDIRRLLDRFESGEVGEVAGNEVKQQNAVLRCIFEYVELAAWIALNSRSKRSPMSGTISAGPWAVIVPSDVAEPPMPGFDPKAFPIFVPAEQAEGVAIGVIDTAAPDSQPRLSDRLSHLIWRVQDRTLPAVAIIGLESPVEPLEEAIVAAGADTLDLDVVPLLCVPLRVLQPDEYEAIGGKLPLLL